MIRLRDSSYVEVISIFESGLPPKPLWLPHDFLFFFQKIKQEIHIPMLYVSHDINEIQQLTDSIWYL